jgi:hypothetical protein
MKLSDRLWLVAFPFALWGLWDEGILVPVLAVNIAALLWQASGKGGKQA